MSKPVIYIKYRTLSEISPFHISKQPQNIKRSKRFVYFEDLKYHYIIEKRKSKIKGSGINWFEGLRQQMGLPPFSKIINIKSEEELRNLQR